MTAGGKWKLPAGATGPDGYLLGLLPYTTGSRMHLAVAEPYPRTLCERGQMEALDTAGPNYNLCPLCARAAGVVSAAALPVDEETAAFWAAQGTGS